VKTREFDFPTGKWTLYSSDLTILPVPRRSLVRGATVDITQEEAVSIVAVLPNHYFVLIKSSGLTAYMLAA
jgi:hypothetical protein